MNSRSEWVGEWTRSWARGLANNRLAAGTQETMPGIFGVIDTAVRDSEARSDELMQVARRMSAAMTYEPFHSAVVMPCPAAGAWIGRVAFDREAGDATEGRVGLPVVLTAGEVRRIQTPVPLWLTAIRLNATASDKTVRHCHEKVRIRPVPVSVAKRRAAMDVAGCRWT